MTANAAPLTERYVQAALRGLPPQQRSDIERELRTSIADAVDAKMEAGSDAAVAEREALTELGDPARLAAGYADRNPAFAQARGWPTTVTNWINPGVLIAGVISVLVTIGQLVSGFATRS